MPQRAFVVRVSEAGPRVVVEDVRTRELVVAPSLDEVGAQIARWLDQSREAEAKPEEESQP